jgi:hypothetical protein
LASPLAQQAEIRFQSALLVLANRLVARESQSWLYTLTPFSILPPQSKDFYGEGDR